MTDGEDPEQGAKWKTWCKCVIDDIIVFEATEGPTEYSTLVCGVEIARCGLWRQRRRARDTGGIPKFSSLHCNVAHPCRSFLPTELESL